MHRHLFGWRGGGIRLQWALDLCVAGGERTAEVTGHLTSPGTIDPFSTGPLALPPSLAKAGDQYGTLVTYGRITGGTKRFAKARGTITSAGFIVDSEDLELKWGNITYVLDLGR